MKQDEEASLLEQAIAISMDDARSSGTTIPDTDMSDANTEDQDLAVGEASDACYLFLTHC